MLIAVFPLLNTNLFCSPSTLHAKISWGSVWVWVCFKGCAVSNNGSVYYYGFVVYYNIFQAISDNKNAHIKQQGDSAAQNHQLFSPS